MKKIVLVLVVGLVGGLGWYLFLMPYEYSVTFRANTFPGTVNQTVKLWNASLDDATIANQASIQGFDQQLTIGDKSYIFKWSVSPMNDSTSEVKVYVSEPGNSLANKLQIPFVQTQLEIDAERTIREFYDRLKEHLQKFKVSIEGLSEFQATYCVCVTVQTDQLGKARGMMANYSLLDGFVASNKFETNGQPFVEVTSWDTQTDQLQYDFCYPIIEPDSLPAHETLKYKQFKGKKALKAIYNGNYITSDRAWYALKSYAEKNDLETVDLPIEVFYNNPNFGNNEIEWKAEIFLPIK